jgi:putative flippase GtrA
LISRHAHLLQEVFRYGLVIGCAFAVDVGTLTGLVELGHWSYLPAAIAGFTMGSLVAYALSVRFVFKYRRVEDRRLEATIFITLGVIGIAANAGMMVAGVEWLGLHYLVAKIVASGVTFFLNYGLRRIFLFTQHRSHD